MSTGNSGSAIPPEELVTDNNDNIVSLDQIISAGLITTSQASMNLNTMNMIPSPVTTHSDASRDEFLRRRREARRRKRQRRAQRRREQRRQERQQTVTRRQRRARRFREILNNQDYRWYDRYAERDRERREEEDYEDYLASRSPTFDENVEETIQEQLLDVYEWEKLTPKTRWEQEELQELEGIAALEQLALVQDHVEQLQHINELERSDEEELQQREQSEEVWNQQQLYDLESTSTQRSFSSTLDPLEQTQQIDLMEKSQERRQQKNDDHDQMQVQEWETGSSQHYHYDRNPCPGLFQK
jgi:hypothetical protein